MMFNFNFCVDCSDHFDPKCYVNREAMEVPENERHKIRPFNRFTDKPNKKLAKCLSEKYVITGDLESMICTMSPLLGCNLIGNEMVLKNEKARLITCVICGRYCGCKILGSKFDTSCGLIAVKLNCLLAISLSLLQIIFYICC
ncbi:uncharacterized protein LOC116805070 isoform X2 [Drosophila grimshawi]|nr:uncharacterized protein LOC116805070 isoform X2 [Drosophila grimshawi]